MKAGMGGHRRREEERKASRAFTNVKRSGVVEGGCRQAGESPRRRWSSPSAYGTHPRRYLTRPYSSEIIIKIILSATFCRRPHASGKICPDMGLGARIRGCPGACLACILPDRPPPTPSVPVLATAHTRLSTTRPPAHPPNVRVLATSRTMRA